MSSGGLKCVFCQDELFGDLKKNPPAVSTCGHIFHRFCLFNAAKKLTNCPLCKRRLLPRHAGPIFMEANDLPAKWHDDAHEKAKDDQMHDAPFDTRGDLAELSANDDESIEVPDSSGDGAVELSDQRSPDGENVSNHDDEADNLNPIEKNIVAENEVPRPNPIQCLDKTDGFNKILVVDMGKRIRATTDNSPINQPLPTKAIPIRVNHRVPYDRNVQLAPRPHNGVEPTVRQSNRKVTPLKHFNYGTVKCSICGRKFFCEAMSTEHYDGRIACSIACYTRAN